MRAEFGHFPKQNSCRAKPEKVLKNRGSHGEKSSKSFLLLLIHYVAKCNLGKVKIERVGQRSSPIAVRDMRGGHSGIRRALLGLCS